MCVTVKDKINKKNGSCHQKKKKKIFVHDTSVQLYFLRIIPIFMQKMRSIFSSYDHHTYGTMITVMWSLLLIFKIEKENQI
jgi:hypothetical protein